MGISDSILAESFSLPIIHTYEMIEKSDGRLHKALYIPMEYDRLHSPFPEARMIIMRN